MNFYDFKLNIDTEEVDKALIDKIGSFLEEAMKALQIETTEYIMSGIEDYMYERFDNVQEEYFRKIVSFLLGSKHHRPDNNEEVKLSKWLRGLGYTEQEFRKRIYEENKNEILEQIQYDAVYELATNAFTNSFFKSWEFKDININYPQSQVVRGLLETLANKDGFQEYMGDYLDEINKNKLEYKSQLERKIDELEKRLELLKEVIEE